jgi:hypothetical protein
METAAVRLEGPGFLLLEQARQSPLHLVEDTLGNGLMAHLLFQLDTAPGPMHEQHDGNEDGHREGKEEKTKAAHGSPGEAIALAPHGLDRITVTAGDLLA